MGAFTTASDPAKAKARDRRELLRRLQAEPAQEAALEAYNRKKLWPDLFKPLGQVSRTTLYRWKRCRATHGLDGLLPRHGPGRFEKVVSADFEALVLGLVLKKERRSAATVWRILKRRLEDGELASLPSQRTVERLVGRLRRENAITTAALHNQKGYKNRFQPAGGSCSAEALLPNDIWEMDTTPADVFCTDGRTHKIQGVIDVCSRVALLRRVERDSALETVRTLEAALKAWGQPKAIRMDNGKNYYQSRHVQEACRNLSIYLPKLPPYTPEAKPHIEKLFGTLTDQLFREAPAYKGNRVANRPEVIEISLGWTPEELDRHLEKWLAWREEEPHAGLAGKSPSQAWHAPGFRPEMIEPAELRELLSPSVIRIVGKRGVQVDGRRYQDREGRLGKYSGREDRKGRAVRVAVDLDAAGLASIYDLATGDLVCIAEDPQARGWAPHDYRQVQQAVRKAALKVAKAVEIRDRADEAIRAMTRPKGSKLRSLPPRPNKVSHPQAAKAAAEKARLVAEPEEQRIQVNAAPLERLHWPHGEGQPRRQPERFNPDGLKELLEEEV